MGDSVCRQEGDRAPPRSGGTTWGLPPPSLRSHTHHQTRTEVSHGRAFLPGSEGGFPPSFPAAFSCSLSECGFVGAKSGTAHNSPVAYCRGDHKQSEAKNKPWSSDPNTRKPWGALGGGCRFPDAVLSCLEARFGLTAPGTLVSQMQPGKKF